jgi:predicted acyltransferase
MALGKEKIVPEKKSDRPETNGKPNGSEKYVASAASARFLSIDFFRGLVVTFMIVVNTPGTLEYVYDPLEHALWFGCTLADVVFPSFLFLVGVSMWFSFAKYDRRWSAGAGWKILRRVALIFLIGLLLNKFPVYWKHLDHWRIMGVLQRIALSYGLAAVLVLTLQRKALVTVSVSILLLYWGILNWFATPGGDPYGIDTNAMLRLDRWIYGIEVEAALHIDHWLFGDDYFWHGNGFHFDSEGLLGVLPSVVTVILGWMSAALLSRYSGRKGLLLRNLVIFGVVCGFAGLVWGVFFPVSKKLWTSSYVLYTGGISMIMLASCIWLIDVRKWRAGTGFFLVFGANPLFAFVLSEALEQIAFSIPSGNSDAYEWLYVHFFKPIGAGEFNSLLFALSYMLFCWLICRWLYVRKIFVKI